MKRARTLLAMLVGIGITAGGANAAVVLGWVDEFNAGHAECYRPNGAPVMSCSVSSLFDPSFWAAAYGNNSSTAPSWAYLGTQGANATGRANARGKVMFRFNATNASNGAGYSITITYARYRTFSIPPLGGTCSSQGTYIGQRTTTFDSYSAGASGLRVNNRLMPVFDFLDETATGDIGYRDLIGPPGGPTVSGCYKIQWF